MGIKTARMLLKVLANDYIRDVLNLNIDSEEAFKKIEMIVCGVQEIDETLGLRAKLEDVEKEMDKEQK